MRVNYEASKGEAKREVLGVERVGFGLASTGRTVTARERKRERCMVSGGKAWQGAKSKRIPRRVNKEQCQTDRRPNVFPQRAQPQEKGFSLV